MAIEQEEALQDDEIQGNILAGFNKDFQTLLGLRMGESQEAVSRVKAWLRQITPEIATLSEVARFNQLYKAMRLRRGEEPFGLVATWINIAFSFEGLRRLTPKADDFPDSHFKSGLYAQSGFLGDPTDGSAEGHPSRWEVGGSAETTPHILLIVASDNRTLLGVQVVRLKEAASAAGLTLIYEKIGTDPSHSGGRQGHEHFGFKDGISQPGVRGYLFGDSAQPLTPRLVDPNDPSLDPDGPEYGRPGEALVWPGQFVFGYHSQANTRARDPGPLVTLSPDWDNGSFLVFRQLRQDVVGFWKRMEEEARRLRETVPGFEHMTAVWLASLLVGRWPSGAPISRVPSADDENLGLDELDNNHFVFEADSQPLTLVGVPPRPSDHYPQAKADDEGVICPLSAHIRKVNSRDKVSEQGNSTDVLTRRILRRGIPFGPALTTLQAPDPADGQRGLLFLSYQTSIETQFEFLVHDWMNQENKPGEPSGRDLLVGQNGAVQDRIRTCTVSLGRGVKASVSMPRDFVIPMGGGYFFAPSISALRISSADDCDDLSTS